MSDINKITLRRGVRNRYYYPIPMPLDRYGRGPCTNKQCAKMTYEVWDQELVSHASFEFLPDAMDEAERLNEIWDNQQGIENVG